MQALKEFRYWDHERRQSVKVGAGEALSERAVNILGDAKIAQLARVKHMTSDEPVVVNAPKRKRGRPKKGE